MSDAQGNRFAALCMLGTVLFNYPVLALFNVPGMLFGVPVLYVYIFAAWATLIALMALAAESPAEPAADSVPDSREKSGG